MSRSGPRLRLTGQMTRTQLVERWILFNVVGAAGIAVQLGTIALLVRGLGWHYLLATAVAVEATVLHNFAWHQHWTWRDRATASRKAVMRRLARFQMLNGAISLGGNLVLMALLTGLLHVDPVLANIIAISTCSVLNFFASERVVFRPTLPVAALLVLFSITSAAASGPAPEATSASAATLSAWRTYESSLDQRYAAARATSAFFVEDREPAASGWRDVAARGGVTMTKIDVPSIPDGKIHHWAGSIFVPRIALDTVLDRLERTAGHESEFYDDVTASKLLGREGPRARVFMKLRRTALITVTYNTEHLVEYRRIDASRASARSVATKIAELADAGMPTEHEKPPTGDSGFLWRLNAYWRYEVVNGGVLIECESVSLSRAVPFVARPIANPIVDRIARDSLERTLQRLRNVLAGSDPIRSR